jgi:hypothetical protein
MFLWILLGSYLPIPMRLNLEVENCFVTEVRNSLSTDPDWCFAVPLPQQLPYEGCCSLLMRSREGFRPFPMLLCLWLPLFNGIRNI